jgi:mono/diheme cytochrome c family protein
MVFPIPFRHWVLAFCVAGLSAQAQDMADIYVKGDTFWETASGAKRRLEAHWQETGFRPDLCGLMSVRSSKAARISADVSKVETLVLVAEHPVKDKWLPVVWAEARLIDREGKAVDLASLRPVRSTGRGLYLAPGKPVEIRDERFKGGIIVQAPAELEYRLDGKFVRFEAAGGVGKTELPYSVRFKVLDRPDAEDACEQVWNRIAADWPTFAGEFSRDGPYWLAATRPQWLEDRLTARLIGSLGPLGQGLASEQAALRKANPGPEDSRRLALFDRAVQYKEAAGMLARLDPESIRGFVATSDPSTRNGMLARLAVFETDLAKARSDLAAADDTVLDRVPEVFGKGQNLLRESLIPVLGTEEILFAVREQGQDGHWYANFGYWCSDPSRKVYAPGGSRLAKLNLRTGEVIDLLSDPQGAFRDPQVSYDGTKVLFCYRRGGTEHYKLHEANIDGSGLRQLLDDPFDDIEPTYLPDGDIVFCSSRCNRWVNCWHTPVATLYRCGPNGENVRPLSANVEHDNTPWPLADGRILFTRWEYVDRSQMAFHHLWTINPDGTAQMVYYGNQTPGRVFIDAKPIPGTDKIVASFCPGHGRREHAGAVTVVSPKRGPDEPAAERCINKAPVFRDPYPISENLFLVARENQLLLMDGKGRTQELCRTETYIHEPRPVCPRPREHTIPARTDWGKAQGQLVLQDVYAGRNMAGVKRGEVKRLLVLESLPKPVNHSGGMDMTSEIGTFTLERVVGTVPVEADGSANFLLPANRPMFFVALDKNDLAIKRMQSFVSVLPGETTSCLGCHEPRTQAPQMPGRAAILAAAREPTPVQPFAGVPDVIDYPRHIQPILDKHCVSCHSYENRKGGAILVGDYGARRGTRRFNQSYWTLLLRKQIADGGNQYGNRAPRSIGSGASPLIAKLQSGHHGVRLSEQEFRTVWSWVETGCAYAGTYASLLATEGPATGSAAYRVIGKRCASCHNKPGMKLPTDIYGVKPNYYRVIPDGAGKFATPLLFNESRPEKSMALLAPLAKEAGGYGICPGPVFKDTADPDYQLMLKALSPPGEYLKTAVLYHMPGFRPNTHYLREMKRYGILPPTFDDEHDPVDVFAVERRYWESFWYRPSE